MTCQERSGFLFAHACDYIAVWSCTSCGKMICPGHTRHGAAGPNCVTCFRLQPQPARTGAEEDDPYLYSDQDDYYDADDYAAFDQEQGPAEEAGPESDLAGS